LGTKTLPGPFDCYASALPDEPLFVLLARDESAPDIVVQWAMQRLQAIRDGKKPLSDVPMIREALNCSVDMVLWRIAHRGAPAEGQSSGSLPSWHSRQADYSAQHELQKELSPYQKAPQIERSPRCSVCGREMADMPLPDCSNEAHKAEWQQFLKGPSPFWHLPDAYFPERTSSEMAPNFRALLEKPLDNIERPKPIPAGTWYGQISKYDFGESREKKTPYLEIETRLQRPGDDIDQLELEGIDISKLRSMRTNFYLTDDALYRLKDFMESCGVQTAGRTIMEALPDIMSAEVICSVTKQPAKNQDGSMKLDAKGEPEYFNSIERIKGTAAEQ